MLARFHRDGMDGLIGRCGGAGFGCGFGCGCVGISIFSIFKLPDSDVTDFLPLRQYGRIKVWTMMS
jgi:hypothetical protein